MSNSYTLLNLKDTYFWGQGCITWFERCCARYYLFYTTDLAWDDQLICPCMIWELPWLFHQVLSSFLKLHAHLNKSLIQKSTDEFVFCCVLFWPGFSCWQNCELTWLIGRDLTFCEHASGYIRCPCKGHEIGCLWLLLLKPNIGGDKQYEHNVYVLCSPYVKWLQEESKTAHLPYPLHGLFIWLPVCSHDNEFYLINHMGCHLSIKPESEAWGTQIQLCWDCNLMFACEILINNFWMTV